MTEAGTIGLFIIIANVFLSYRAFNNFAMYQGMAFKVDPILIGKDYKRIITSGFVHVSWMHLIFNMLSFFFFSARLEAATGSGNFLLIYFGSLIGGNLLALYIHRNHGDYAAVGASGAVSGVIFSAIALFPGMELGLLFLPIFIPSWAFGLLFVAYSVMGIKSQSDNIGHEAHLGGGLVGLLITIGLYPEAIRLNPWPILAIVVPSLIFFYIILAHPNWLIINKTPGGRTKYVSVDDKFNIVKKEKEEDIDRILDKISQKGIDSLTQKEKQILERYSGKKGD